MLYADLLLHIVDASNEKHDFQMEITNKVLKEIGAHEKEMVVVFNKMDKVVRDEGTIPRDEKHIYISAKSQVGINIVLDTIKGILFSEHKKVEMLIPYDKGEITSFICKNSKVEEMTYENNGTRLIVYLGELEYNKYHLYITHHEGGDDSGEL